MYVPRKRRLIRVLLAMATVGSLTGVVGKAQTFYTYTVIADASNCQTGPPAINNKGEVAFGTFCVDRIVIRRGDGGPLTPIYTPGISAPIPNMDVLSINDSGVVAFSVTGACTIGSPTAIWTGDGEPVETVVDICTEPGLTSVTHPSISNTGAVAFMASSANESEMRKSRLRMICLSSSVRTNY
jgi:hypothetical protein